MKKTMLFIGSVIILILSAITFIFIPAMAQGAGQDSLVFGKYGNKKIEYKQGSEFANAVANYTEMYRRQGIDLKDSDYYTIYNYAFVSAVQAIAYADNVKKSGWEPSKESVARQMYQYFTDEKGNYSPEIYNSYSADDKSKLQQDLTRGLIWNRCGEDFLGTQSKYAGHTLYGLKSSDAEKEFFEKMASEKRSFDLAVFDKKDYPESQVKAFGAENKDKFTKYNFSVITVKDQSKAKSILNQLTKEEITFSDAVSEYSDKAYSGADGKLSSNYGYQIQNIVTKEDDEKALFALELNQTSGVVETSAGYSIFHNDLIITEPDFTDSAVIATVRSYINENETSLIENYFIEKAKAVASDAEKKGFEAAGKSNGAKVVKVPAFALNYANDSMLGSLPEEFASISGASTNENLLEKAFALKNGDVSEPVVSGDSILVVKATGTQKDNLTDSKKEELAGAVNSIDSYSLQMALLSSDKVKNDVANVFFTKMMKN